MKKNVLLIILLILLFPMFVYAEKNEYEIRIKVNLENKELEDEEFSFQLLNSENEVIQTKQNDTDGNVVFEPISFSNSDATISIEYGSSKRYGYKFYTVQQVIDDNEDYIYDEEIAYVGVYVYNDGTSEVHYLKNLDEMIDSWKYKANRDESKIFHATAEQLQGQAYAEYNPTDGTLTFFRDEANKYTNNTTVNGKTYFTDFENTSTKPWVNNSGSVKKVIFNDAIKPITLSGWFSMRNLEEIENINLLDTSSVTSMKSAFDYAGKLTKLDLSTWDTSKVTDMSSMFYNCENLEEVYIDNFNTSKVENFRYMFSYTIVRTVDPSVFDVSSATGGGMLDSIFYEDTLIEGLDFSSWNNENMGTSMLVSDADNLKYVDASTFKKIGSNGLYAKKLSIVKLSGDYEYLTSGIGTYDYYWYNTKNRTLYEYWDLRQLIDSDDVKTLETAIYVRPDNNPNPSIFINKYKVKQIVEDTTDISEVTEILKNPETSDKVLLFVLLIFASLNFGIYCYKRKDTL